MSNMTEEMWKILVIKWLWTMPYHPQTNGLVEIAPDNYANDWEKIRKPTGHLIWLK